MRLSKKPKTFKYTFGLKRTEIIAAIINASILIINKYEINHTTSQLECGTCKEVELIKNDIISN